MPDELITPSVSASSSTSTSQQKNDYLSLAPIHESDYNKSREIYAAQYNRALHAPTRFLPQNQAVITTNGEGRVLLFNDIASLCFGINKLFIGESILNTLIEDPFRNQITRILDRRNNLNRQEQSEKGPVLVCGTIIPIVKLNGLKSVASLWLKEKKTDHSKNIYIWIFEEIYDTSLSVYVDSECIIRRVLGTMIEIYGYQEKDIVGKPVNCLVPALSKEKRDDNVERIDRLKFFGSQSSQGIYFPVILNLSKHIAIGDDDLSSFVVKITSLPTITGLMTINRKEGVVKSLNPVPAKYLFGYSVSTIVEEKKMHYKDLIPQLSTILTSLMSKSQLSSKSPVAYNQTCVQILEEKYGAGDESVVYALHRDGSQFEIELQLKLKEKDLIDVWISYDRIDAANLRVQRIISDNNDQELLVSPLTERNSKDQDLLLELNNKNLCKSSTKLCRISSFGAVDNRRRLFPSSVANDSNTHCANKTIMGVSHDNTLPPHSPTNTIESKKHPLDDYVILELLGQGTYGMAKLAYRRDDPSQKKLVIKYVIKSKIIVDSWIRDRQLGSIPMEIHILRTLQKYPHPNCCRLACAVKHLHQHRIVHRDIKDENIILDNQGEIHLIDFGCAAYYKKDRKFDTFTGTLEYCAPEVLKGKPYEGPPQDIWASGILLFTLIYRENPFYNFEEIMERELRVPYKVSEGSLDLIKKMLERDIKKRITIDQVLAHPWLRSLANSAPQS
ncbi:kinase-like domain-containing protein [Pilaira anomala]|nr:kinase-like domain-containing protein [Pilaira anomala]